MSNPDIPRYPAAVPDAVGTPDDQVEWVDFGPLPHQQITPEVAHMIMALWLAKAPANVGTALTAAEVGPLVIERLSPHIMSLMLTAWRDRNPALFGSYLAEALTGARPSATRQRGPR